MNPRINTVLEPSLYKAVEILARAEGVSLSQKVRDLVKEAVDLVEDAGLEVIVEERRKRKGRLVPLAEIEKKYKIR